MSDHVTKATGQRARWLPSSAARSRKFPVRLPRKKKFDVADFALPAFALTTGAMVGLSAPQLIDPSGLAGWIKIGVLTGSAALVSYIVNRYAIQQGAELTARGYLTAGLVSVGSILIVGGGLFASTYAGLTIERVNDLKLQRHAQALSVYLGRVNAQASQTGQAGPAIDAAVADIELHVTCEARESCLSGRGNGGRGRVTRALEPLARRARQISLQLQKGEATRKDRLMRVNGLIGDYQTSFSATELDRATRRRKLSRLDARIKQEIAALAGAMPLALLRAYAAELEKGIRIPNRAAATRNVNALLRRHGRTIVSSLENLDRKRPSAPEFPQQAGVSSTFAYIGHFLPIAALAGVIELIMPLTLWVYMMLSHLWRNYRDDPNDPGSAPSAPQIQVTGGRDAD